MTASASSRSGRGTGPQSSANPSGVRRIERTVTPVRTVEASGRGERGRQPADAAGHRREHRTSRRVSGAITGCGGGARCGDQRAARTRAARPGPAAPPAARSRRRARRRPAEQRLDQPIDDLVAEPLPHQIADGDVLDQRRQPAAASARPRSADSDEALSTPDARAASTSDGIAHHACPPGAGAALPLRRRTRRSSAASIRSSPRPAARARSSRLGPPGQHRLGADVDRADRRPSATRSLPPTCGVASSTVTAAAGSTWPTAQAAASPEMPPPTTTTSTSVGPAPGPARRPGSARRGRSRAAPRGRG